MSVDDDQCAAYVTEFESDAVEIALSVVQGIVTNLLLTVSHETWLILRPLLNKCHYIFLHHIFVKMYL